jgi:hypothetical protein
MIACTFPQWRALETGEPALFNARRLCLDASLVARSR